MPSAWAAGAARMQAIRRAKVGRSFILKFLADISVGLELGSSRDS
jgi:hypothetical protein